ncbi:DUF4913 domain-containing protein [Gordonia rhizosphera]|uniref:DUF4913 domain-containing protein n=1 Tax=Gordonia rhizosphera NBRC 16068 TaxID=1108045 RepID=K6WMU6_9ACTN|nr:DUF4913 domain-containing protein [Gordonia rhizosphera]GAB93457.1 hypothetical protein GORHZ_222_00120 [Gordonia rhizosphera NBRC 16068]
MSSELFADEDFDDDDDDFDDDDDEGTDTDEEHEPQPEFGSVYEFVDTHLVRIYARKVTHKQDRRWCPRWFEHPEAVSRLEALWRAYEALRLDPATGMSTWWRDHADYHMKMLMAPDGPFEACSADQGHSDRTPTELPTDDVVEQQLLAAMSIHAPALTS